MTQEKFSSSTLASQKASNSSFPNVCQKAGWAGICEWLRNGVSTVFVFQERTMFQELAQ